MARARGYNLAFVCRVYPFLLFLLHGCSFATAGVNTHLTKDIVKNWLVTDLGYITFDKERRYAMETYSMLKTFRAKDPDRDCYNLCLQLYNMLFDDIVNGLQAMAAKNYHGMFEEATATGAEVQTCEFCMGGRPHGNPVAERNQYLLHFHRIIVAIALMLMGWP
ncbi:hypothetical protein H6P81_015850 [Aristolochia fimbriata]|uniref:Uncharacterized protein n=1 Tax=Aristolochia fimbriata TaxID=158543 RepID=A0AAV7E6P9_ARIFI|nr:hypothetical protein H6P81_015850 [Aristolochia fimbriata]